MFARLLMIFILLPLADLVLIWMFLKTNVALTILWILVSGVAGAWYVKRQGVQVLEEIRATLHDNQVPTNVLIEGAIVFFAGGLLITPGLLTDIFGFSMLVRPCRRWYRKRLVGWLKKKVKVTTFTSGGHQPVTNPDVVDATVVKRKSSSPVHPHSSDSHSGIESPIPEATGTTIPGDSANQSSHGK